MNYYYAEKCNDPKAVLFYFHGMNSHGNNSGYFAMNIFDKCEINVYAMDFKNFGQSGGE